MATKFSVPIERLYLYHPFLKYQSLAVGDIIFKEYYNPSKYEPSYDVYVVGYITDLDTNWLVTFNYES